MQWNIQPNVYEKFCELKMKSSKDSLSDNDFLSLLLDHVETCGFHCLGTTANPEGNSETSKLPAREVCPECKFTTSSSENLYQHFESVHDEVGSFSCTCSNSYVRLPDFLRHYISCPVAATDLQEPHLQSSSKKRKRSPVRFNYDAESPRDDTSEHGDGNPEVFHSYRHPSVSPVAGPSEDKPFGCPKCLKGFKSKPLLDQHMHLHYPPRYKCRWCGNVYRWPPVYYHHKQKCPKRPVPSGVDKSATPSTSSRNSCFKAEKSSAVNQPFLQAQKALAQFLHLHVPQSTSETDIHTSAPFLNGTLPACSMTCICTEVFPSLPSYFDHAMSCPSILSASSLFESLAPPNLLQPPDFSAHSTSDGPDPDTSVVEDPSLKDALSTRPVGHNGIFTCSICGKDFNSKLSLKQHVDGKHRAEGKYLCRTCGKRYRWGASFYYHKRTCVVPEVSGVVSSQTHELLTSNT